MRRAVLAVVLALALAGRHSLAIDGNGVNATLSQPLPRGDTGTLTVELKPGTYTFYCPVDSHKGRGMSHTVTVK
jgi:plastocyanin